ncbi:MAG: hypothetical protein KBF88_05650 [Polyangiaceae bacterium]|nr:hypothetical protein [Polyangiaceae bacterium]
MNYRDSTERRFPIDKGPPIGEYLKVVKDLEEKTSDYADESFAVAVPSEVQALVGDAIQVGGPKDWVCIGKLRMRLPWLGEEEDGPEKVHDDPDPDPNDDGFGTQTVCVVTGFGKNAKEARDSVKKQLRDMIGNAANAKEVFRRTSIAPPPPPPMEIAAKPFGVAGTWLKKLLTLGRK